MRVSDIISYLSSVAENADMLPSARVAAAAALLAYYKPEQRTMMTYSAED